MIPDLTSQLYASLLLPILYFLSSHWAKHRPLVLHIRTHRNEKGNVMAVYVTRANLSHFHIGSGKNAAKTALNSCAQSHQTRLESV